MFSVGSLTSEESIKHLLAKVEDECSRIFPSHSFQTPCSYRDLLQWIENENKTIQKAQQDNKQESADNHQEYFSSINKLHSKYTSSSSPSSTSTSPSVTVDVMVRVLRYLHTIGRVVTVDDNTVCTDPTMIPNNTLLLASSPNLWLE